MILARNLMNHAEVAPDRQERVPSKAMIIASSASDRTVERGSDGAVFISSTVARLRHFATVLRLMPNSLLNCASEACDHSGLPSDRWRAGPPYCCSDSVRGRGVAVTNLSHRAPSIPKSASHHQTGGANR